MKSYEDSLVPLLEIQRRGPFQEIVTSTDLISGRRWASALLLVNIILNIGGGEGGAPKESTRESQRDRL